MVVALLAMMTMFGNEASAARYVEFTDGVFNYQGVGTRAYVLGHVDGTDVSGEITIPMNVEYNEVSYLVTQISSNAFKDCTGLTRVTLPSSITNISSRAFSGCTGLTNCNLPSSLTTLGEEAFSGSGITSIVIPNTLTSISDGAFAQCSNLTIIFFAANTTLSSIGAHAFEGTAITGLPIPETVTSIGSMAFYGLQLTPVIPSNISYLGNGAFGNNTNITSVSIPESLISIDGNPFMGCANITSIVVDDDNTAYEDRGCNAVICKEDNMLVIGCKNTNLQDANVTIIGESAFEGCTGLTGTLTIPNTVTEICARAFANSGISGNLVIPESVETIGEDAFSGTAISSITLPSNISSIASGAFGGCNNLTSVIIPASLTEINGNPFKGCANITSIIVDGANEVYTSNNSNAVICKEDNKLIVGCKGTNLQDSNAVIIGESAFEGCTGLTGNLTIPSSVIEIEEYAFAGCTGLTGDLIIHNDVNRIADHAFANCTFNTVYYNAEKCYVGQSNQGVLELLGKGGDNENRSGDDEEYYGAFVDCGGVLVLGSEVDSIGPNMFNAALFTGNITVPAKVKWLGDETFGNLAHIDNVYFNATYCQRILGMLAQSHNNILAQAGEPMLAKMDPISSGVKINRAVHGVFYECPAKLTIGNTVEDMGEYLFENSGFTGELIIPSHITTIADGLFKDCASFTKLTMHNGITEIGNYAFEGFGDAENNSELTLTIPSQLTVINVATFKDSSFSGALNIPAAVKKISDGAFMGCNSFTSLDLNTVEYLGDASFAACNNMAGTLTIPSTLTHMGIAAFSTSPDETFENVNSAESRIRDTDMAEEMVNYGDDAAGLSISEKINANPYNNLPTAADDCGAFTALVFANGCPLLEEIPHRAFWGRCGLGSDSEHPCDWSFPNSIKSIGICAFAGCYNLTGCMELPASVKTIEERAFALCSGFSCIDLGSVETIGSQAFLKCTLLTNLTDELPATLENLYGNAFDTTGWFNNYGGAGYNGVIYLDEWVMGYKGTHAEDYVLTISATAHEKSIKRIAIEAFANRTDFKAGLSLPEGIQIICESAFAGCTNMTGTLTIPSTVTVIGPAAFSNVVNSSIKRYNVVKSVLDLLNQASERAASTETPMKFTAIEFTDGNECDLVVISEYAFRYCNQITGNLQIPNGVTSIGEGAFMWCSGFNGMLKLPRNITEIAPRTFYRCTNLNATASIPPFVKEIGGESFFFCTSLKKLIFAKDNGTNDLQVIGERAFYSCSDLFVNEEVKELVIPDAVTYIGDEAFYNCTNICSFVIGPSVTYIGTDAFKNTCWYDSSAADDGLRYLRNWCIGGNIDEPLAVVSIKSEYNNYTITHIAPEALNGSNMWSLTIPNTIKYIGVSAFANVGFMSANSNVLTIAANSQLEIIDDYAFAGLSSALPLNINIPASVTRIGVGAYQSVSIKNLVFQEDEEYGCAIETIDDDAFSGCTFGSEETAEITLPSGLVTIGDRAFASTNIETLHIPSAVMSVGYDILDETPWFDNQDEGLLYVDGCCLGYKGVMESDTLELESNTRVIAARAFQSYFNLKGELVIPDNVEAICESAFENCYDFTEIVFGIDSKLRFIEDNAFNGCYKLTGDLILPRDVRSVGAYAFADCKGFYGYDVILPKNLLSIGAYAFDNCMFGRVFTLNSAPPMIEDTNEAGPFNGVCYANTPLYIPAFTLEGTYQYAYEWNKFTTYGVAYYYEGNEDHNGTWEYTSGLVNNWLYNYMPGSNDFAVILDKCNMTASHVVDSLYIAKCGTLNITNPMSLDPNPKNLLIVKETCENRGNESNLVLESELAQLIHNTPGVKGTVNKLIFKTGSTPTWTSFTAPVVGKLNPEELGMVNSESMNSSAVFRFNQDPTPNDQNEYLEWENYWMHNTQDNPFNLDNGVGYIYASLGTKTYKFAGEFKPAGAGPGTIDLDYKTGNPDEHMRGWNFVGNPFPCDVYTNRSYYIIQNNTLQEVEQYSSTPLPSGSGIMVYTPENDPDRTISFNRTTYATTAPYNNGSLHVTAKRQNKETREMDRFDGVTVSFNEGGQLPKFVFNEDEPSISIMQDGKAYGIATSDKSGSLPLRVEVPELGFYTLSVDIDEAELFYLHLIDKLTGEDVDLLVEPEYSFTAKKNDNPNRFMLVFKGSMIESGDDIFAYQNGSDIIVDGEGELQIFDVMGRMVKATAINGVETINMPENGVYIFRMVGNDIKTQKIVVR